MKTETAHKKLTKLAEKAVDARDAFEREFQRIKYENPKLWKQMCVERQICPHSNAGDWMC